MSDLVDFVKFLLLFHNQDITNFKNTKTNFLFHRFLLWDCRL